MHFLRYPLFSAHAYRAVPSVDSRPPPCVNAREDVNSVKDNMGYLTFPGEPFFAEIQRGCNYSNMSV